jgi:hypothetical protein
MKTNIDFPRAVYQNANFDITLTVDVNLTSYKVRCEIYDELGNFIKLANTAAGGGNTEILLTPGTSSTIVVYVPKNETTTWKENCWFEVNVEDSNGKVTPLCKQYFYLNKSELDWSSK